MGLSYGLARALGKPAVRFVLRGVLGLCFCPGVPRGGGMFCVTGERGTVMGVMLGGYACFAYGLLSFQVNHYPIYLLNTPSATMSRKGKR